MSKPTFTECIDFVSGDTKSKKGVVFRECILSVPSEKMGEHVLAKSSSIVDPPYKTRIFLLAKDWCESGQDLMVAYGSPITNNGCLYLGEWNDGFVEKEK